MPIGASDVPIGFHEHRVRRHDVENGKRKRAVGMIERQAMRGAPAAVMADDMKAIEAKRPHQPDLIARHGAE